MKNSANNPDVQAVTPLEDGATVVKGSKMDDLRDRIAKAEARLEALKENFQSFVSEVKAEYKSLKESVDDMKATQVKLIVITTLLANGGAEVAKTVLTKFF